MVIVVASNLSTAIWKKSVLQNDKIMERKLEMRDRRNKKNPDSKSGPISSHP